MKLSYLFVTALFLFTGSLSFGQKALPSVEVKTLDGQTIDIQDYAKDGKITVISFWATWCSPCKKELSAIAEVYEEWQEAYDMELVAITLDTQRALAKVKPMVEASGWTYTTDSTARG